MKQVIYKGLSSKCMMFALSYVDEEEFNKEKACLWLKWYFEKASIADSTPGIFMLSNMDVIHILDEEKRFGDGFVHVHTCMFVYKLGSSDTYNIFSTISNLMRNRSMPEKIYNTPAPFFMSLKVMIGNGNTFCVPLVRQDKIREIWLDWFQEFTTSSGLNDKPVLAVSAVDSREKYLRDRNGWYGTRPQTEIVVSIHDNLTESINDNEHWLFSHHLCDAKPLVNIEGGAFNHKLYAHLLDNTLVISDNKKGYDSIKKYLTGNILREYDLILVNQYGMLNSSTSVQRIACLNHGYNDGIRFSLRTLTLYMVDRKKLSSPTLKRNTTHLDTTIPFMPRGNGTRPVFNLQSYISTRNSGSGNNYFVVPYEQNKELHIRAMEIIHECFATNNPNYNEINERYLENCFLYTVDVKGDAMSEWFKACTANAASDEERLREAYLNLKEGLIKEYQEIGVYLSAHNMNNKKPIPTIKLGAGFEHNPAKKVSFDRRTKTYQRINYIDLPHPISVQEMRVKYLIPIKGKSKNIIRGDIPYEAVYNKTDNSITLDAIDLFQKNIQNERMR